jgi:hypothetical protein
VRTETDLGAFLKRIEQYLNFFFEELGGRAATPFEVKALAQQFSEPLVVNPEPVCRAGTAR